MQLQEKKKRKKEKKAFKKFECAFTSWENQESSREYGWGAGRPLASDTPHLPASLMSLQMLST